MNIVYKICDKIKRNVFGEFPKISYSRTGEDLLLDEFFQFKSSGFYIDIGAYHPVNYSNTFKFYLKGWKGINIDPNKEIMRLFEKVRPLDYNLNLAISNQEGEFTYYMNDKDPSMNTISEDFATQAFKNYGIITKEKRQVKVETLENLIKDLNLENTIIDFLSVDVEGHDLEVLQSNNWDIVRPKVILVEIHSNIEDIYNSEIYIFLKQKGYKLLSYTHLNDYIGNAFFVNIFLN